MKEIVRMIGVYRYDIKLETEVGVEISMDPLTHPPNKTNPSPFTSGHFHI